MIEVKIEATGVKRSLKWKLKRERVWF